MASPKMLVIYSAPQSRHPARAGDGHGQARQALGRVDGGQRQGGDVLRRGILRAGRPCQIMPLRDDLAAQMARHAFYAAQMAFIKVANHQDAQGFSPFWQSPIG
jgi:hypothetical protein